MGKRTFDEQELNKLPREMPVQLYMQWRSRWWTDFCMDLGDDRKSWDEKDLGSVALYANPRAVSEGVPDGRIPLDNSDAEKSIRSFCVGRNNWHIAETKRSAKASGYLDTDVRWRTKDPSIAAHHITNPVKSKKFLNRHEKFLPTNQISHLRYLH